MVALPDNYICLLRQICEGVWIHYVEITQVILSYSAFKGKKGLIVRSNQRSSDPPSQGEVRNLASR